MLDGEKLEALAIRAAKGNNGGEWLKKPDGTQHYTEAQKDYWRQFVRDLAATAWEWERQTMSDQDDAAMQAECVVRALDMYLAMMPWPAPTVQQSYSTLPDRDKARKLLVDTLAATIRMSEPRKSEMQRALDR